jgi:2-polyprenyl-3-methyl-5-hydroxy-6-metoxy-1,4-benzoquinol methylase
MYTVNDSKGGLVHLLSPLHQRFRASKIRAFLALAGDRTRATLLDVGGNAGINGEFLPLYRSFASVTTVNICPDHQPVPPNFNIKRICADGCDLPFEASSFDWVFCNAVIEHVGDFDRQQRLAAQIRRVARGGYFVTTPNKWFPVEQHTYMPLYQFMPRSMQRSLLQYAPGWRNWDVMSDVRLLSYGEMRGMFPEAAVYHTSFRNTIIASYSRDGEG